MFLEVRYMCFSFLFTAISLSDHSALAEFCKDENIEFVVVGPEAPLAAGKYISVHCMSRVKGAWGVGHLIQFILEMKMSNVILHRKKSFHPLEMYVF